MEILRAIDTERIRALRDRGEFFWLDLADPKTSDLDPLRELLTIHPLAFEDTNEFGQRAKLDHYPQSALLVVYGAAPRAGGRPRLVEVHLHISGDALVTVSREPLAALDDAPCTCDDAPAVTERPVFNTGEDAGRIVFHVHLHLLGGEPLGQFGRPVV